MLMMGPSNMFEFPKSLTMIIAAFPILGFFQVFFFIPIIPELIERLQVSLEIAEGADEYIDMLVNDKCNDAYGFIFASSMFISPLVGSALYLQYGAGVTCDYVAILDFTWALILLFFNCGPHVFTENRKFNRKLHNLRKKGMNAEIKAPADPNQTYDSGHNSMKSHVSRYSKHSGFIAPRFGAISQHSHSSKKTGDWEGS